MTPTERLAPRRPLAEPFSTGRAWLSRALVVSIVAHALVVAVMWWVMHRAPTSHVDLVDIEIAPPPPPVEALPAEVPRAPESAPEAAASAANEPPAPSEEGVGLVDAGVDAPPDAAPDASLDAGSRRKKRPDAAVEEMVAEGDDAGAGSADAGTEVAATADAGTGSASEGSAVTAATETGSGSGSGEGTGVGSAGSGVAAATENGSGSGVAGVDVQPAVEGAPTTAGTAANLLSYFPPGHQVTALIRFDRLRGTEWAAPAEKLFKPMPDYQALFGDRPAGVADKLDTLVISSPRPRDATATSLVVHSALTRAELRDFLANTVTPIAWSTVKGGMLGTRSGVPPGDRRILLSPWRNWVVLAPPADLAGITSPARGSLDTIEAKGKLPAWLQSIRTIESESGDDKRGPALVLTLAGPGGRFDIPDIGIGVTSLPSPERISLALELVKQGWLIRGNIVFSKDADAAELETALAEVKQRIVNSTILSNLLKRQHALNLVTNLSISRTGARVSYATSLSVADMRALLAAAAVQLDAYFAGVSRPDEP